MAGPRVNYEPSDCPHCGARANTIQEEIEHMQERHPDIIEERLTTAGFRRRGDEWIDTRASDD